MRELPVIACSLSSEDQAARIEEFRVLLDSASVVEPIEHGARITLPLSMGAAARDLMAREQACCPFWDISIAEDADALTVEMRAPAEAAPLVERLLR